MLLKIKDVEADGLPLDHIVLSVSTSASATKGHEQLSSLAAGGTGLPTTMQTPIRFTGSDSSGNGYPALVATSNIRGVVPAHNKDNDGSWYGTCRIPQDYVSTPKIILRVAANATSGAAHFNVYTSVKGDGDLWDAALTAETAQDVTMPATAYTLKDVTFTLSTTPVAGKTLTVRVQRDGTHVNDTLAVDSVMPEAVFQYNTV